MFRQAGSVGNSTYRKRGGLVEHVEGALVARANRRQYDPCLTLETCDTVKMYHLVWTGEAANLRYRRR